MAPPVLVRKWTHELNIIVTGAAEPKISSITPAMFANSSARARKSRGTTWRTSVNFLMSLSDRPVVESATFSCILMRSSADSTSSTEPVKAFLSRG